MSPCRTYESCKRLLDLGRNIDYEGASGPLDFTDIGDPSRGTYDVFVYNPDGTDTHRASDPGRPLAQVQAGRQLVDRADHPDEEAPELGVGRRRLVEAHRVHDVLQIVGVHARTA